MFLRRFANYLLTHRWQALLLTFASTFIPVIGVLSIIVAAFMTLVRGAVEGLLFTLMATIPYVISYGLSLRHAEAGSLVLDAAIGGAVLSNLLTWVFGVMLLRKTNWSTLLQIAALSGVLVVSIIHLGYPGIADWWGGQLQSSYQQAASVSNILKNNLISSDQQVDTINITKQYATGLMTAAVLFNAIVQLMVARWWQLKLVQPGLFKRELHHIRLSRLAGILFLASFVLSYWGNRVVLDIMPILYILFGAAGLSVIHYLFGLVHSPMSWFWLALLYLALIYSFPASIVFISVLAVFDIGFDIRKRFKKV